MAQLPCSECAVIVIVQQRPVPMRAIYTTHIRVQVCIWVWVVGVRMIGSQVEVATYKPLCINAIR